MPEKLFNLRIPQRVADKMLRAKHLAETENNYKPISWGEWLEADPRLQEETK